MVRIVTNNGDLQGIKPGEDWVFDGWPELEADQDMDAYFRELDRAQERFASLVEFANKEAEKNAVDTSKLDDMKITELRELAKTMGVDSRGVKTADLRELIREAM